MKEKKIYKCVCIGAGYFAKFHVEAWSRMQNVAVVAICDKDITKASELADAYNIDRVFDSLPLAIQNLEIDFVDIITPPATHFDLINLSFKHGLDVVCQKPVAETLEKVKAIKVMVENSKNRFMVHENFRFMPWFREVKKLLDQKVIGENLHCLNQEMRMGDGWGSEAYMNRQPYFREMKRLLMYETGIHFIDVFRFLAGDVRRVTSRMSRHNANIAGEDFAIVLFDFEEGGYGIYNAGRYNESTADNPRLTFGKTTIEGDQGTIRIYLDGRITIQKLGEKERDHQYSFEDKNFSGDCVFNTQKHFIDCLERGEAFETNIQYYIRNVELLEEVYE